MRRTGKAAVNIDLVPEAVGAERDINRRKPLLLAAAACLLGGLALWAGFKFMDANASKSHLDKLTERESELNGPGMTIKGLEKKNKDMVETLGKYHDLEKSRKAYAAILDQLASDFAHDEVWVTDVTPVTGFTKGGRDIKPLIKDALDGKSYGKSAVNLINTETGKLNEANAIRITGLWRKDSGDVYKILKKIRNNENSLFTFKGIEKTEQGRRTIEKEVDLPGQRPPQDGHLHRGRILRRSLHPHPSPQDTHHHQITTHFFQYPMNWFKENKFLGTLILVTLVLAALIWYVGHTFAGKAQANVDEIEAKKNRISSLERSEPFPNPANADAKKTGRAQTPR